MDDAELGEETKRKIAMEKVSDYLNKFFLRSLEYAKLLFISAG